jgi:DNA-binding response OmpR family regulator
MRILLVEDNRQLSERLARTLQRGHYVNRRRYTRNVPSAMSKTTARCCR